ncbi:hypothetical protein ARMGADRAFT_1023019 [Armillaria gallica]|uniref:Uncharacterized protein n=1 Tax=Armillaria gallica TaxID=47427 RepID=A0A2H3ED47_ARMGA|nr:hypothetical protein ARMGADRAFT_1023019 [Armillaria gallica]
MPLSERSTAVLLPSKIRWPVNSLWCSSGHIPFYAQTVLDCVTAEHITSATARLPYHYKRAMKLKEDIEGRIQRTRATSVAWYKLYSPDTPSGLIRFRITCAVLSPGWIRKEDKISSNLTDGKVRAVQIRCVNLDVSFDDYVIGESVQLRVIPTCMSASQAYSRCCLVIIWLPSTTTTVLDASYSHIVAPLVVYNGGAVSPEKRRKHRLAANPAVNEAYHQSVADISPDHKRALRKRRGEIMEEGHLHDLPIPGEVVPSTVDKKGGPDLVGGVVKIAAQFALMGNTTQWMGEREAPSDALPGILNVNFVGPTKGTRRIVPRRLSQMKNHVPFAYILPQGKYRSICIRDQQLQL